MLVGLLLLPWGLWGCCERPLGGVSFMVQSVCLTGLPSGGQAIRYGLSAMEVNVCLNRWLPELCPFLNRHEDRAQCMRS